MIKKTWDLEPGDIIYIQGERAAVEMIAEDSSGMYLVRHSLGRGWFKSNGRWLVEEPLDDVVRTAETIANRGRDRR